MKKSIVFVLLLSLLFCCGCRERKNARPDDTKSNDCIPRRRNTVRVRRDNVSPEPAKVVYHASPVPGENEKLYTPGAVHAKHQENTKVVRTVYVRHDFPRRPQGEYIPPSTKKFNETPVATLDFKPALGEDSRRKSYRPFVHPPRPRHFHPRHHRFPPPRRHGPPPRRHGPPPRY